MRGVALFAFIALVALANPLAAPRERWDQGGENPAPAVGAGVDMAFGPVILQEGTAVTWPREPFDAGPCSASRERAVPAGDRLAGVSDVAHGLATAAGIVYDVPEGRPWLDHFQFAADGVILYGGGARPNLEGYFFDRPWTTFASDAHDLMRRFAQELTLAPESQIVLDGYLHGVRSDGRFDHGWFVLKQVVDGEPAETLARLELQGAQDGTFLARAAYSFPARMGLLDEQEAKAVGQTFGDCAWPDRDIDVTHAKMRVDDGRLQWDIGMHCAGSPCGRAQPLLRLDAVTGAALYSTILSYPDAPHDAGVTPPTAPSG